MRPLIEAVGLSKRFGRVEALRNASLRVYPNEVVGLVGEKGAGKTTLVKILSGAIEPDGGEIYFEGRRVAFQTPKQAIDLGIKTVYQDLALVERANVYRNIFLGEELQKPLLFGLVKLLDVGRMVDEASRLLESLGVRLDSLERPVKELSEGQRQAVAIARCLRGDAKLILMDEPTAALGLKQVKALQCLLAKVKRRAPVLLATPILDHVAPCADRIVVLDKGRVVGEGPPSELTAERIARMILDSRVAGLKPVSRAQRA